jgi:cell division protein FtsN
VVQLGVRGSEAQAREAFAQMRGRFGDALSGAGPVITQAQVNGNTLYRVRAGPMERDEANAACTKIKAAGGDCFVARN